jgi:hypothetical protein
MDWNALRVKGLAYDDYLDRYGSPTEREKWERSLAATVLSDSQVALLTGFRRRMTLLCMSGTWCGDCVEHVPILRRFELTSSVLELRLIDREAEPGLKDYLTICGSPRVPQTVVLSEDHWFVDRWGDRPLAKYRDLAARLTGAACSSGLILPQDPLRQEVVQDWLDEIERSQLILRTSPGLRSRYGD